MNIYRSFLLLFSVFGLNFSALFTISSQTPSREIVFWKVEFCHPTRVQKTSSNARTQWTCVLYIDTLCWFCLFLKKKTKQNLFAWIELMIVAEAYWIENHLVRQSALKAMQFMFIFRLFIVEIKGQIHFLNTVQLWWHKKIMQVN